MANPPTMSKRRWLQFSLRSGFVVVTALCVALTLWVVPMERKRRAVAAIEAINGAVSYRREGDSSTTAFLRRWLPQVYLDEVMGAYLSSTQVTDAGLAHLQGLTSLQALFLDKTQVTDAGLVHLQGLTNLRQLDLDDTHITDAGLVHLRGLTGLQELYIDSTQITDVGLARLQGLTSLQGLGLVSTQITDAGLVHLQKLTSLKGLIFTTLRSAMRV